MRERLHRLPHYAGIWHHNLRTCQVPALAAFAFVCRLALEYTILDR